MKKLLLLFTAFVFAMNTKAQSCSAGFSASVSNDTATFANLSTGSFTNVIWDFGDGSSDTSQNPQHIYSDTGSYYVCLTIYDTLSCYNQFCDSVYVASAPPPPSCDANYSFTVISGNLLHFDDLSTGSFNIWLWNFGDGAQSALQNPNHNFPSAGTFTICLTVSDSLGSCADTFCSVVNLGNCWADFTYYLDSVGSTTMNFFDGSSSGIVSYEWDFGDGSTDSVANPVHDFSSAGNYYVCLTITDSAGCINTYCETVNIPAICFAGFSYTPDMFTPGLVNFTDASTPNPIAWEWDFGDGTTDSTQNPQHIYNTSGGDNSYLVCLTMTDASSCTNTFCDSVIITNNGNCFSSFWYQPDSADANTIYFTDYSFPVPSTWQWDFGDGITDNMQNPVHTYAAPGMYDVCLTISDSTGCTNTSCQQVLVGNQTGCAASFTYAPDSLDPFTLDFTDASTNATDWFWDFGDGDTSVFQNPSHTFDSAGWYNVCLTINDSVNNCVNYYCEYIEVSNCYALFTYQQDTADLQTFYFTYSPSGNPTDFYWDFGDGSTDTAQNPTYTYAAEGWYYVCLTASDSSCSANYCEMVYAGFNSTCYAYYSYWADSLDPYTINFFDYSSGSPTQYLWDFGDGTTDTVQFPAPHTYATPGFYTVCLTISDSSGSCYSVYCDSMVYAGPSTCQAAFTYTVGFGNNVSFTDASTGSPVDFYWDFGDGATSTQQNPSHVYNTSGSDNSFLVCLTVSDFSTGCNSTFCDSVYIPPPCTAGFSYFVNGNVGIFTDASTGTITGYSWDFNGDLLPDANTPNAYYSFPAPGYYNVCLTVSDFASGCFNTYCDSVYIAPSTGTCQADFTYIAYGDSVEFTDVSTGNPVAWSWDFDDPLSFNNTSNQQNPTHVFSNLFGTSYNVCLTITAPGGCYDTYCDTVIAETDTTGIVDLGFKDLGFRIYPNPNNGKFQISKFKFQNLEIYNVLGEKVYEMENGKWKMENGNTSTINHLPLTIDLSAHPKGIYFVKVQGEGGVAVRKIVVE